METPMGQTLINATSQVLATDTHRSFSNLWWDDILSWYKEYINAGGHIFPNK